MRGGGRHNGGPGTPRFCCFLVSRWQCHVANLHPTTPLLKFFCPPYPDPGFFSSPPPPPRDSATRERFHSRILSRSRVFCVDGRLDDIFNDPIILSVFSRWWILIFVSREKKLARWAWLIWFIYNDYEMERNRNFHFYVFHGTFERQLKLGGGGNEFKFNQHIKLHFT